MTGWSQFEGTTVGGVRLGALLGTSEHSAVFSVELQANGKPGVLKLVRAMDTAAGRLERWRIAQGFRHPHLVRLFEIGEARVGGEDMIFVTMERGDEVLAEILRERSLDENEGRQMLPPILDGLDYLHARGFAHGHLKASNIIASGDNLKISSDGIVPIGEASSAGDLYALGTLLVEALTGNAPAPGEPAPLSLPAGLREIADGCLQLDARHRWTTAQVRANLQAGAAVPPSRFGVRKGLIGAGAVILIAAVLGPMFRDSEKQPVVEAPVEVATLPEAAPVKAAKPAPALKAAAEKRPSPVGPKAGAEKEEPIREVKKVRPEPARPEPPRPEPLVTEPPKTADTSPSSDAILRQAKPDVASNALATIRGTVRTSINIQVDSAGNVASASVDDTGGSPYFSQTALRAAKQWKFAPSATGNWILRFNFRSNGIETFAAKR